MRLASSVNFFVFSRILHLSDDRFYSFKYCICIDEISLKSHQVKIRGIGLYHMRYIIYIQQFHVTKYLIIKINCRGVRA